MSLNIKSKPGTFRATKAPPYPIQPEISLFQLKEEKKQNMLKIIFYTDLYDKGKMNNKEYGEIIPKLYDIKNRLEAEIERIQDILAKG
jgi:hypothetical protein